MCNKTAKITTEKVVDIIINKDKIKTLEDVSESLSQDVLEIFNKVRQDQEYQLTDDDKEKLRIFTFSYASIYVPFEKKSVFEILNLSCIFNDVIPFFDYVLTAKLNVESVVKTFAHKDNEKNLKVKFDDLKSNYDSDRKSNVYYANNLLKSFNFDTKELELDVTEIETLKVVERRVDFEFSTVDTYADVQVLVPLSASEDEICDEVENVASEYTLDDCMYDYSSSIDNLYVQREHEEDNEEEVS